MERKFYVEKFWVHFSQKQKFKKMEILQKGSYVAAIFLPNELISKHVLGTRICARFMVLGLDLTNLQWWST